MGEPTTDELLALQGKGANARALGLTQLDNPLCRAAAMPAATGDSIATWTAKYDAWELGWTLEDAMR